MAAWPRTELCKVRSAKTASGVKRAPARSASAAHSASCRAALIAWIRSGFRGARVCSPSRWAAVRCGPRRRARARWPGVPVVDPTCDRTVLEVHDGDAPDLSAHHFGSIDDENRATAVSSDDPRGVEPGSDWPRRNLCTPRGVKLGGRAMDPAADDITEGDRDGVQVPTHGREVVVALSLQVTLQQRCDPVVQCAVSQECSAFISAAFGLMIVTGVASPHVSGGTPHSVMRTSLAPLACAQLGGRALRVADSKPP